MSSKEKPGTAATLNQDLAAELPLSADGTLSRVL